MGTGAASNMEHQRLTTDEGRRTTDDERQTTDNRLTTDASLLITVITIIPDGGWTKRRNSLKTDITSIWE